MNSATNNTPETVNAWIDSLISALLAGDFAQARAVYDTMDCVVIRARSNAGFTITGLKYGQIQPENVSRKVAGLVYDLNQFRAKVPAWLASVNN